jgi:hypothetical protein
VKDFETGPISVRQFLESLSRAASTKEDPVFFTACPTCGKVLATSGPVEIVACRGGEHQIDYEGKF